MSAARPGWAGEHLVPAAGAGVGLSVDDQLEVQRVVVRYTFLLDQGDPGLLEDLFVEDAVWHIARSGRIDQPPLRGRGPIVELVRASRREEVVQRRHHLHGLMVHSGGGGRAEVHANLLLTAADGDGVAVVTTGVYRARLRRDDGVWRIAELFLGTDTTW